jgi:hypothetical protein
VMTRDPKGTIVRILSWIVLSIIASQLTKYEIIQESLFGGLLVAIPAGTIHWGMAEKGEFRKLWDAGDRSWTVRVGVFRVMLMIPVMTMTAGLLSYGLLRLNVFPEGTFSAVRIVTRVLFYVGFWTVFMTMGVPAKAKAQELA